MSDAALSSHRRLPFFTPGVWVITAIAILGAGVALSRFLFGLGAVTNLDQLYPWGIWIAIDVSIGVALAAGGFMSGFFAHIIHRDRFHAITRPALLTAALGYTFVALAVAMDLGRYYNMWYIILPSMWQGNSVLFEVGICVLIYLIVLWMEMGPIILDRFIGRFGSNLDRFFQFLRRNLNRIMSILIIMGVVLSCMHQSSLGSLMVIAPSKVHPLWHTPVLGLFFLLSAFTVGLAMIIFESMIAHRSFRLPQEMTVLSDLARFIPVLLAIYFTAKLIDMVGRSTYTYLFTWSTKSVMYWLEIVPGVVIPFIILFSKRLRNRPGWLFTGATLTVLGVVLNRINVFLVAYSPPYADYAYFPAWTEIAVTVGFIAMLILLYRFFVFNFSIIESLEAEG